MSLSQFTHSEDRYETLFTGGGRTISLSNPKMEDVWLNQICQNLSRIPRFNGATNRFFSIASHSIFVSLIAPSIHQVQALLHDATEAYIGDITLPIRQEIGEEACDELEMRFRVAICEKFGLTVEIPEEVKEADAIARAIECDFFHCGKLGDYDLPFPDAMVALNSLADKSPMMYLVADDLQQRIVGALQCAGKDPWNVENPIEADEKNPPKSLWKK